MKPASGAGNNSERIRVLSVGPMEADHDALSQIMSGSGWPLCPESQWVLDSAPGVPSALAHLAAHKTAIVVCESELGAATWRELREQLALLPDPPFLIVASRLADERLWAEALNLGAYDVLAKPFDANEVVRTLSQAWLHRTHRPTRKSGRTAVVPAKQAVGSARPLIAGTVSAR